jgi:hypothetical protein
MLQKCVLLLVLLLAISCKDSQPNEPLIAMPEAGLFAFLNVNVVPMDREVVLPEQTVIVRDGAIESVGPAASIDVPATATTIDAAGQYLMPGLVDLHVHVRNKEDLPVYLASGVTTILDLGGPSRLLDWRAPIENGELLGPHLLVAYFLDGPGGEHNVMQTPEEARDAIREAHTAGYDYVKVYNSITKAQFDVIAKEAEALELAIVGHGVRQAGMEYILRSGQVMVAHAEEYIYTYFRNSTNRALIPAAVEMTRNSGAYVLPNLSAFEAITLQWGSPAVVDAYLARPEARYLHPSHRTNWMSGPYSNRSGSLASRLLFLRELTLALSNGDVPLLLGTDSPIIPGMFAGSSIHDDLRNLIEAQLTPYKALSAGTRTAGEFVRGTRPGSPVFGVIAEGARADLVLLAENPLEDVAAARSPLGVMVSGRWLSRQNLNESLEALVEP